MAKLTVYKASAGSGKTYRLTEEYIKFLFRQPGSFRNILAVTFTNKATGEMKGRILKELFLLSRSGISNEMSDHYEAIVSEFGLDEQQVSHKAKQILSEILHHYSRFNINTIDRFFHQVIRGFVKEIGLNAGFTIELEDEKVLHQAVDNLMNNLEENGKLMQWLVDFVMEKIDKGKSWDIRLDMYQLGKEIFKESFKYFSSEITEKFKDRGFLDHYRKQLFDIKIAFDHEMRAMGKRGMEIMSNASLDAADFKYGIKRGVGGFMMNAAKGKLSITNTIRKALDNPDEWCKKGADKEKEIMDAYHGGLNGLLRELLVTHDREIIKYNTANEVLAYIYMLGILADISKEVRNYANEKNIFMISDGAKLLYEVIRENDTPFIYEKAGNHFYHFMIDEFQDTSKMQWDNFKPLVENSLANNYNNMLVGDVKQSIYRWRNSDWDILASGISKDFSSSVIDQHALENNYRSKRNIVACNNTLFPGMAGLLQNFYNDIISSDAKVKDEVGGDSDRIRNAYKDVRQNLPEKENKQGGYIDFQFIPEKEGDGWQEKAKEALPGILENLQDKGYHLRDIAILIRKKSEGKEIADFLINYKNQHVSDKYKYDVISGESLYIGSSPVIQFVTGILRFFVYPDDAVNNAYLVHEYKRYIQDDGTGSLHALFKYNGINELTGFLSDAFAREWRVIRQMPVYEMVEKIIALFGLNKMTHEIPYLEAFQDAVLEYLSEGIDNTKLFLEWWEETGEKKSIASPEQQDAITIMTIHKAKGLQFKAIIVPFCNWPVDNDTRKTNIIWCKPQESPFNNIGLVPVRYSNKLAETFFYREYYEEKLKAFVDNLNLLYVTFTRPENALYAFIPLKEKDEDKIADIADLLYKATRQPEQGDDGLIPRNQVDEAGNMRYGTLQPADVGTINDGPDEATLSEYITNPIHERIKLRLYGRDFFSFEEDKTLQERVNYGNVMHEVFQKIKGVDDVDKALSNACMEGKLDAAEKNRLSLYIKKRMDKEVIREWFSPEWEVRAERDILIKGKHKIRPDRVLIKDNMALVIDFKFGEIEVPVYKKQIEKYKSTLYDMGYRDVKGYLWYVKLDKIDEV